MEGLKLLIAKETTRKLCEEPRDRELLKTKGTLREYRVGKEDAAILRSFKKEYDLDIKREALLSHKSLSEPRFYGPRELGPGTIASPEHTITILIPLAPRQLHVAGPQELPKVQYQHDRDDEAVREPMPWHAGIPVQIPGNSRIVVEKGFVCFEMVQYDWELAQDGEVEGERRKLSEQTDEGQG